MTRFRKQGKQLRKPLFLELGIEIIDPQPRLVDDVKIF